MTKKSETPSKKTPPVSFYLGADGERDRRLKSLEIIAEKYGFTRSVLLQKVADGELALCTPTEYAAQNQ